MEDNSAKRSKYFSKQELEVLVEEVVSRQRILMGKLDNVVTADNKKRAWAKVAQSVSAVGETERDAIAIKKKWADVKSLVKKKAAERTRETRKTGGGTSSVKLDALEEKILGMIGESLVGGVQGGVDTGDNSCMQLLQQTQTGKRLSLTVSY